MGEPVLQFSQVDIDPIEGGVLHGGTEVVTSLQGNQVDVAWRSYLSRKTEREVGLSLF